MAIVVGYVRTDEGAAALEAAGAEVNNAVTNPFFGVL